MNNLNAQALHWDDFVFFKSYLKRSHAQDFNKITTQTNNGPKEFIQFLHFIGEHSPLKFSYAGQNSKLVSNLSVRQNIYLDSIPLFLTKSKEFELTSYIQRTGNIPLHNLATKLEGLDLFPCTLNPQQTQISVLIKALIQKSKFLILNNPQAFLSHENKALLFQALHFIKKSEKRIILLKTNDESFFQELITKTITRDGHDFLVENMPRHSLVKTAA